MSFSSELERALSSWNEDEAKVTQDTRLVDDIYTPGGGSATYARAIQQNYTPSAIVDSVKAAVLSELEKPRGIDYAFGLGLESLTRVADEIDSARLNMAQDLSVLAEMFNRTPATSSVDRAQLTQDLGTNLARLDRLAKTLEPQTPTSLADAIVSALSVGDPSQVEEYLAARGISPSINDEVYPSQVVEELSTRIYGVSTPSSPTRPGSGINANTISTGQGGIIGVAGAQSTTVNEAGEVTITLEQGRVLSGQIQSQKQQNRLKGAKSIESQSLKSKAVVDQIVEESRFEVWACAVLDIVDQIQASIALISLSVDRAQAVLLRLRALVNNANLGRINFSTEWPQIVLDVPSLLGELVENLLPSDTVSSVSNELSAQTSGARGIDAICDQNHQRYCTLHGRLLSLQDAIGKYTQRLSLDLGGLSIEQVEIDFGWSPSVVLAAIDAVFAELSSAREEINDISLKLKRETCAWVSRKIKGRSKTVALLELAVTALGVTVASLRLVSDAGSISGLEVSPKMSSSIAQLKKLGLTQAADKLERLDFSGFVSMDRDRLTGAGETSSVLRQAAWTTNNQTTQTELWQLHQIAQTRHEQQVAHIDVRQAMTSRYYTSTDKAQRAYVSTQSEPLVKKVDDELTANRNR